MARDYDRRLVELLAIKWPIIQAPMAGVSTPAMAAAVSNCGGLGSLGIGAMNARDARAAIVSTRSLTDRPFNVNVFCHRPAVRSAEVEAAWVERLRPEFEKYGERGPSNLSEIYKSFVEDDALLAVLLEERPAVVSFHFGLPSRERIEALRNAGIVLLASVTNLSEANLAAAAGVHALVAQGYEAGGHRGVFDPDAPDNRLGNRSQAGIA
jgi:nitronate monooxygenase